MMRIKLDEVVNTFVVVETYEGDALMGTVTIGKDGYVLKSGFRGHPWPLREEEIAEITEVEDHRDVEVII